MTTLRFGIHRLPSAEAGLIRTLFRLYAHGTADFRWSLVTAPPYDALLIDTTTGPDPDGDALDPTAKAVLKLTSTPTSDSADSADSLERPIRSEKLEAWLLKIQRQHVDDSSKSSAAALAQTERTVWPDGDSSSKRFKLLRWPPALVLRNDPHLIRMATLLSRRAMNLGELASLAQLPQERALDFLNVLKASMLLKEQTGSPRPAAPAAKPGAPEQKPTRGLISRIRLHLGL